MDPNRGRPVYGHRPSMSNGSLIGLLFLVSLCVFVWVMLIGYVLNGPVWEADSGRFAEPLPLLVIVSGAILNSLFLLSIPLFISGRFIVTTKGLKTPFSLFARSLRGKPDFIFYRDIDKIFPQFLGGFHWIFLRNFQ